MIIPATEIEITTSRSGGPGGQHVNKTSSRVTLRWNVQKSLVLSESQKRLIISKLKNRINQEGELVLHVDYFRSQTMNRDLAFERLQDLMKQALQKPKRRIKTKVTKSQKTKRLDNKKRLGLKKKLRRIVGD